MDEKTNIARRLYNYFTKFEMGSLVLPKSGGDVLDHLRNAIFKWVLIFVIIFFLFVKYSEYTIAKHWEARLSSAKNAYEQLRSQSKLVSPANKDSIIWKPKRGSRYELEIETKTGVKTKYLVHNSKLKNEKVKHWKQGEWTFELIPNKAKSDIKIKEGE
ncbi:MAG: hypothetical protein HRT89_09850 [Lentisphaeria bacterium]|nr:hypothetical protein [Lentisphaeria bacterium]NQZ68363.1 hypothetical protein [Lentisphaeria bacterium]